MDIKGITWVGNVYQKFEALCLEVEEVMYQDTVKYVENQVQNVGASVKRFYSDVMEDLISPNSLETAEHNNDDEVSKKTKASKKKELSKGISENVRLDVDNLCRSSGDFGKSGLRSRKRHDYNKFNREAFCGVDQSQQEEKSNSVVSSNQSSHPENMVTQSSVTSPSLSEGASHNEIESRSIADLSNEIALIKSGIDDGKEMNVLSSIERSVMTEKSRDGEHGYEEISVPESSIAFDGNLSDWNLAIDSETTVELEPERIDESDDMNLGETMVVVDEVDLRLLPRTECKKKPYKKKLREALCSRMRLGRKHEYEQLALQHGDGKILTVEDSKFPHHDLDENDWELL